MVSPISMDQVFDALDAAEAERDSWFISQMRDGAWVATDRMRKTKLDSIPSEHQVSSETFTQLFFHAKGEAERYVEYRAMRSALETIKAPV